MTRSRPAAIVIVTVIPASCAPEQAKASRLFHKRVELLDLESGVAALDKCP